jgi:hypothetical protein
LYREGFDRPQRVGHDDLAVPDPSHRCDVRLENRYALLIQIDAGRSVVLLPATGADG